MLRKIYCAIDNEILGSPSYSSFVKRIKEHDIELEMWQENPCRGLPQALEEDALLITDSGADKLPYPVLGFQPEGADFLPYRYIFEDFETLDYRYIEVVYKRFYGIPLDILETDRLRIREITTDDIDRLYEIYAEPSITRYTEGLYPEREKELEFVQSYIDNMYAFYGYGMWGVCEKESGRLIGRAGLSNREFYGKVFLELGYIIEKNCQQKGYATEACSAIIEYARTELLADAAICLISPENIISKRVAIKLGFEYNCNVTVGGEPLELYVIIF